MPPEKTDTETTERESVQDPSSLEGRISLVRRAWYKANPSDESEARPYVEDIYQDRVIVSDGDDLLAIPYTVNDDAQVSFGDASKVTVAIDYRTLGSDDADDDETTEAEPLPADAERFREAFSGEITESLDGVPADGDVTEAQGWEWGVTIIRPGISKNGWDYSAKLLREAAGLYEGAKAFDGHRDAATRRSSPVAGIIGYYRNVEAQSDGRLTANLRILRSARPIRDLFVAAHQEGRQDLIGFSHDIYATGVQTVAEGGRQIRRPSRIVQVSSVDTVADPSAGGGLERLVAGGDEPDQKGGDEMPPTRDEILAALKDDPKLATEVREAVAEEETEETTERTTETEAPEAVVLAAGSLTQRMAIREALADSKLPEPSKDELRKAMVAVDLTEDQIAAQVKATESIWDSVAASVPARLGGQQGRTEVTDEADKLQAALDGLMFGRAVSAGWDPATEAAGEGAKVPAFHSIHQAYAAFSGVQPYGAGDTADYNRRIMASVVGCFADGSEAHRISESIVAATWGDALRDSMTKRAIAEYRIPGRQAWRQVVSEVGPVNDFRTQNRFRVGGYDTLGTVGEGDPYPSLVSPTDENATYAVAKRGGVDDLTMETIANDDVGAVRSIPINMGRAAILTLFRAIFIGILADNATIYDSVALFAAGHSNTDTSAALARATLSTGRRTMRSQARLGETSGTLGFIPRTLVVPNELEETAFVLSTSAVAVTSGEDATVPNIHQGLTPIVVDELIDANDWFLVANPAESPTIEVGFYQGREDPEILVQDAPAVGSVFTADKITYKVRHIWGTAVLDFRSFYRGQG